MKEYRGVAIFNYRIIRGKYQFHLVKRGKDFPKFPSTWTSIASIISPKDVDMFNKLQDKYGQITENMLDKTTALRLLLERNLVFDPEILFLDEPTAGLDPQARRLVWDYIQDLKNKEITIILMTHDMVEAEALSDRVAIIDRGKIIAEGTPTELKEKYGSDNILEVSFLEQRDLEIVKKNIDNIPFVATWKEISKNDRKILLIAFQGGLKSLVKLLQQGLIENIDEVENMKFRQNSLEDVFLNLTGRRLRD